ncbi:hypothetical protein ACFU8Q_34650 [Streptomyces sp. NPDC057543]|uniref:hypothetical protein n=1 Tax=Streptomyces sp. NPDC057543 TaxID=3346163 RepID=UPI0036AE6902
MQGAGHLVRRLAHPGDPAGIGGDGLSVHHVERAALVRGGQPAAAAGRLDLPAPLGPGTVC